MNLVKAYQVRMNPKLKRVVSYTRVVAFPWMLDRRYPRGKVWGKQAGCIQQSAGPTQNKSRVPEKNLFHGI